MDTKKTSLVQKIEFQNLYTYKSHIFALQEPFRGYSTQNYPLGIFFGEDMFSCYPGSQMCNPD